jgi:hypothetical protein
MSAPESILFLKAYPRLKQLDYCMGAGSSELPKTPTDVLGADHLTPRHSQLA